MHKEFYFVSESKDIFGQVNGIFLESTKGYKSAVYPVTFENRVMLRRSAWCHNKQVDKRKS